jgi:hypothetical protein
VLEHVIDVFERSTLELWNKSPTEDNGDNGDGTVCEGDDIDEVRVYSGKSSNHLDHLYSQTNPTFPPRFPYCACRLQKVTFSTLVLSVTRVPIPSRTSCMYGFLKVTNADRVG